MEQPILAPVADAPPPIEADYTATDNSPVDKAIEGLGTLVGSAIDSSRISSFEADVVEAEDSYGEAIQRTKARLGEQLAEIDKSVMGPFKKELARQQLIANQTKRDKSEVMVEKEKIFRKYATRYPGLVPDLLKVAQQSGLGEGVSYETQAIIDEYNSMLTGEKPGEGADAATRWDAIVKLGEKLHIIQEDPRFADADGNVDPDKYAAYVIKISRERQMSESSSAQKTTVENDRTLTTMDVEAETSQTMQDTSDYYAHLYEAPLDEVARILSDPTLEEAKGPNYAANATKQVLLNIEQVERKRYAQLAQAYTDNNLPIPSSLKEQVANESKPYRDILALYSPKEYRAGLDAWRKTEAVGEERKILGPQDLAYLDIGKRFKDADLMPTAATNFKKNATDISRRATDRYNQNLIDEEAFASGGEGTLHYNPTMNRDGSFNPDADPYREEIDAQAFNPQKNGKSKEELAVTRILNDRLPRWISNINSDDEQLQRRGMFQVLATITGLAPLYDGSVKGRKPDIALTEGLFRVLAQDKGWEVLSKTGVLAEEKEGLNYAFPLIANYEINTLAGIARDAYMKARDTVVDQRGLTSAEKSLLSIPPMGMVMAPSTELLDRTSVPKKGAGSVFLTIDSNYNVSFTTTDPANQTGAMRDLLANLNRPEVVGRMSTFAKVSGKLTSSSPDLVLQAITSTDGFPKEFIEPSTTTEQVRDNNGNIISGAQ